VLYFAYASNLNRKQMLERIPNAIVRFTAVIPNHKIVFAGWSRQWRGATATIQQSRGDKVNGGIYEISEQDLRRLAQYEGPDYSSMGINAFRDTGEMLETVTFVHKQRKDEGKPSADYLLCIKQGYLDWGLTLA